MKVVLFIDYGPNKLNKELKEIIDKSPFPQCRTVIVDYIEKNGEFVDRYRNVYKLANSFYSIQDVDISRPWRITDYDGSEYIQYLDYNIVDKSLNYCELKDDGR